MDKEKGQIFAVDFDGTVVTHAYPSIGMDIGGAPVLKRLVEQGNRLILYTMRSDDRLAEAKAWFDERGIVLWGVNENPEQKEWTNSTKVYANVYLDDAALGCPLTENHEISDRPFANWFVIERMLEDRGILRDVTVADTIRKMNNDDWYADGTDQTEGTDIR